VIDTREPEAVLEIADSIARDGSAPPQLWDALFTTAGYRDLQAREAAMQRPIHGRPVPRIRHYGRRRSA
jgi:hypothetical protein